MPGKKRIGSSVYKSNGNVAESKRRRPVETTERVSDNSVPIPSGSGPSASSTATRVPTKAPRLSTSDPALSQPLSHPSWPSPLLNGTALSLGQNIFGQLGVDPDDVDESRSPRPVELPDASDRSVVQVVSGGMHTVLLTGRGSVYSFGCNDEFALGRSTEGPDSTPEHCPARVEGLPDDVRLISAGDSHSAALTARGSLYVWGNFRSSSSGSIGLMESGVVKRRATELLVRNADPRDRRKYLRIRKMDSGENHLVALTEDGCVYTLGSGVQGQLGRLTGAFLENGGRRGLSLTLTPQKVKLRGHGKVHRFADVFAGDNSSFALTEGGCWFAWGLNNYDQLGLAEGGRDVVPLPERVPSLEGVDAVAVGCGQHHALARSAAGQLYAVGRSHDGRLGIGAQQGDRARLTEVASFGRVARHVAAGIACSFSVTEQRVYAWGSNGDSQLGVGKPYREVVESPTPMVGKELDGRRVLSVSVGGQHAVLLVAPTS